MTKRQFLVLLIFIFITYPALCENKNIFDDVPSNYEECMQTDPKFDLFKNRNQLKCEYIVESTQEDTPYKDAMQDNGKYKKCVDTGKTTVLTYSNACSLVFYNPAYEFPKSYVECINGKGEFSSSINEHCEVKIDLMGAFNPEDVKALIGQCSFLKGYNIVVSKEFCFISYLKTE